MELKAVLFDLWGTLIIDPDNRSAPRQVWRAENVRAALERAGIILSFESVHEGVAAAGVALSALHDESRDTNAQGRVDLVLNQLGVEAALSAEARDELETAICTMHPVHKPQLAEGAIELLRASKEMGLATALVSNAGLTTAVNLRLMLDEFGLSPYLDVCAFSDELLVAKPDARLFLEPLHELGIDPPSAAFVGDSPHNDIYGARQAGLLTVQIGHREAVPRTGYTESDSARPHARLSELSGFFAAIAEFADLPQPSR